MSTVEKSIQLRCQEGRSDKVYQITIEKVGGGYVVNTANGRYGSALVSGTKTASPVTLEKAVEIHDKVIKEKLAKRYKYVRTDPNAPEPQGISVTTERKDTGLRPQLLNMIDESEVETYILSDDWGMQEKLDGRHMMVRVDEKLNVTLANKKGIAAAVSAPGISTLFKASSRFLKPNLPFTLDCELVGDQLYPFDLLELGGQDIRKDPYSMRVVKLDKTFAGLECSTFKLVKFVTGRQAKRVLLASLKAAGREGAVFKHRFRAWSEGRPNSGGDMLKFKFWESCSCIVSGVNEGKRSIRVRLGDVEMGNVTIPPNFDIPEPKAIVEVKYLYVAGEGGSLYQPIYLGERDDVDAKECTIQKQRIKYKDVKQNNEEVD